MSVIQITASTLTWQSLAVNVRCLFCGGLDRGIIGGDNIPPTAEGPPSLEKNPLNF